MRNIQDRVKENGSKCVNFSFFQYVFFDIGVKWFKIIGQYFSPTFLSIREGIMNNERH